MVSVIPTVLTSISYHRYSESSTKVLGDAVLSTKDITTTPTMQRLKLINPAGKFKGEVGYVIIPSKLFEQIEVEVVKMDVDQASSIEEHRVYEYQRWQPVVLWGSDFPGHFLPTDPGRFVLQSTQSHLCRWSSADGQKFGKTFAEVEPPLEEGWTVLSQWTTTLSVVNRNLSSKNSFFRVMLVGGNMLLTLRHQHGLRNKDSEVSVDPGFDHIS